MPYSNPAYCSAPRRSVNFDLFMVRSSLWAGLQRQVEELSGVRAGRWHVFELYEDLPEARQSVRQIADHLTRALAGE